MSVKSVVRDIAAGIHEREQQLLLALLNCNLPTGPSTTIRAETTGMTTPRPGSSDLALRVMQAIERSELDFRTPLGLARELNVDESAVRAALKQLGGRVRRPIGGDERYQDWYRSAALPPTRREKWWRIRSLFSHAPLGV